MFSIWTTEGLWERDDGFHVVTSGSSQLKYDTITCGCECLNYNLFVRHMQRSFRSQNENYTKLYWSIVLRNCSSQLWWQPWDAYWRMNTVNLSELTQIYNSYNQAGIHFFAFTSKDISCLLPLLDLVKGLLTYLETLAVNAVVSLSRFWIVFTFTSSCIGLILFTTMKSAWMWSEVSVKLSSIT